MSVIKQELPPPGGFKSVQYERVPLKKYWPASLKWLALIGTFSFGTFIYSQEKNRLRWSAIERRAAFLSILPLLMAEHDRTRLKIYRRFRDEEAEIMKDVEGWKVGTYKGQPLYKTVKPNEWYDPRGIEPWIYIKPKDYERLKGFALHN